MGYKVRRVCQTSVFRHLLFLPLRCLHKAQTLIIVPEKKQMIIAVRLMNITISFICRCGDAVQVWEPVYREFRIDSLESFQVQIVPGMKVRDFPP